MAIIIFRLALLGLMAVHSLGLSTIDNSLDQLSSSQASNGSIWVVLVAGSSDYSNYRHQADVCHAYQVVRSHGIPESNIITFMYDDIAYNKDNPTPGVIINQPKGPNVYEGVKIDYKGHEVTPENFLRVLEGDESFVNSGRKVVKSSPSDHIFVYFSDHGAPGLIAFPSSELLASDLMRTIDRMYNANRYSKMVLYIEACESGSMFEHLLKPTKNVFAMTAANSTESSWACFWDEEREAYLGDVFSVTWLADADTNNLRHETIQEEFRRVKAQTNRSHVMEFGDLSISHMAVSEFVGRKGKKESANMKMKLPEITDAVMSHDVPLMMAKFKAQKQSINPIEQEARTMKYKAMVEGRTFMEDSMRKLTDELKAHLTMSEDPMDFRSNSLFHVECYEEFYRLFDEFCFDLSTHPYALRFLYVFVNVCEGIHENNSVNSITHSAIAQDVIRDHCTRHVRTHPFRSIV